MWVIFRTKKHIKGEKTELLVLSLSPLFLFRTELTEKRRKKELLLLSLSLLFFYSHRANRENEKKIKAITLSLSLL
jgi:hypothetical protein